VDSVDLAHLDPPSIQSLGEEVYAQGQIDSARTLFGLSRRRSEAMGDTVTLARALTWMAQASWRLGDYTATRELGEESLALKTRLGLEDELFRSYNVLGLLAWNESRLLDASGLFSEATQVALATGDSANLAKVSNNLALVRTGLGEFGEAERGFLVAREMARAIEDPLIEGRVLINLGMLALEVGDPLEALGRLQEARPVLLTAEDPVGLQSAVGHLGVAYAAIGEPGRAIACLDSALHQARMQGLKQEEASNLEQLAQLHHQAGNHRRALQLFQEARVMNAQLGLSDELASDLARMAQIRASLGNLDLALQDALEALSVHREIGSPLREVEDLVVLAELSSEAGHPEDAEGYIQSALELSRDLGVRAARLPLALGRARVALHQGEPQEALRILDQARSDIQSGGYDVEWEAHALRSRAHEDTGDLESAAAEGRQAVETVERVRGSYASGMMRDSYLRERAETYSDLVMVLLRMGHTEEAFRTADAARGRALIERMSSGGFPVGASGGIEAPRALPSEALREFAAGDQILRRIEELTRTLADLDEVALEGGGEEYEAQATRLAGELRRLRSDYAASLVRAEEHDPEGAALLGGHRIAAERIRGSLEPDEALLEYLVTDTGVGLFLLTGQGLRYFETDTPRRALASRIRIAREALKKRGSEWRSGSAALEGLHEILFGAAERAGALSGIRSLVVVPHGELTYLPFSALKSKTTGRFLVEDYLIHHLPTAGALPVLRDRVSGPGGESGWGPGAYETGGEVDVVAFAPFPSDLPGTALEMEVIRQEFEGGGYFEGPAASEARFWEGLRRRAVIHAATHGVMNFHNPLFSRIEFAAGQSPRSGSEAEWTSGSRGAAEEERGQDTKNDGRLEVHELLGANVGSLLVFLSGCETGMGPGWSTGFGRGEEFTTLGQAFLYAGAQNVIGTLWRIDDPGAATFAGRFYRELGLSGHPVEALAYTQRALIRNERYGAPFYWAAYRLTGAGDLQAGPP
jgi:CHAT domain-containing protein